jgi:signal peptide peptidase SppA
MKLKKIIKKIRVKLNDAPVIGNLLNPRPAVAVVRMSGIIMDGSGSRKPTISYKSYASMLEDAFDAFNLKAVALVINSPGGSPAQSELIGRHIRALSAEKKIPVIAFVEDVAASGGYWLACAADEIYTAQTSIVGSIGVISASFGLKDLIERYGVERRIYTSGKDKSFLDPFVEEKPGDVKRLKGLQKDLHQSFIDWVKARRGDKLKGDDKTLFEGGFWLAEQAQELGLIDGLGSVDAQMKERFGENVKLIPFGPDKGLLSALMGGEAKLPSLGADDILDSIETRAIWGRYGL